MKLKYYSCYPYAADDYGKEQDGGTKDCRFSHYTMPFRVYLAATCTTNKKFGEKQFLDLVWEILDMPNYKGVEDYHQPFRLEYIDVVPTKHLYGATNTGDGIYEFNGHYLVKGYGTWHVFKTWKRALDKVYYFKGRPYLYPKGIDYTKPE